MTMAQLPPAVAEAIEWLALQRSGAMLDSDRQRFQHWLGLSAENQLAWQRLQQRLGQAFADVPAQSHHVLSARTSGRRQLLRGALAVTGVGVGGWWLQRIGALPWVGSDLQTGFAERRPFALEDGSQLVLNAQSRVDIAFGAQQRTLTLREGALSIQVAADSQRPLVVVTPFGEAQALGTRFTVLLREHSADVWVQESRVKVRAANGASVQLSSGQGARLSPGGIQLLEARHAGEGTWEDGFLEVHDQALGSIIEALRPYRRGIIRISPEAAELRVSGVFPLDDSTQALRSLEETLPLRVEQRFGWWTQITLR